MDASRWQVRETEHFAIHYPPRSYAADRLASIADRAERTRQHLQAFVGPALDAPARLPIYLDFILPHPERPDECLDRGCYVDAQSGAVWAVCRPESPAERLEEAIAHALYFAPLAPAAGGVPFLRAGLTAYVVAFAGRAPAPQQAHAGTLARMQRAEPLNCLPAFVEQSAVNSRDDTDLALSLFAYLAMTYGVPSLQQFLHAFTPQNPDEAALGAFQKPLPVLHDEWLGSVAALAGGEVGVGEFFRRLGPYLKLYPFQLVEILIYILFAVGYIIALRDSQKFLIDNVIGPPPPSDALQVLFTLLAVLGGGFVVNALGSLRCSYLTAWVTEKTLLHLRYDMFQHLMDLSAGFYSRARVGDVVSRMSNDLVLVQQALFQAALFGLYYMLSFVLAIIVLFLLDWRLSLVVVVCLPLLFVATRLLSSRVSGASRERSERLAHMTDVIQERLHASAVVRTFGLVPRMMQQFNTSVDRLFGSSVRLILFGSLFSLSSSLISALIQLIVLGLGAYLILTGNFTTGSLFAFLGLLGSVTSPVEQMTLLLQQLHEAAGSMERVVQILHERVEVEDAPGAVPLAPLHNDLRFEHVTFSYGGDRPALEDLSLSIAAGQHVAIVRPSGAGKSSSLNLIMRFYDSQQGRVTIDGQDIRQVTQDSLRAQMGVVLQDTFVFNTTIRENLLYGRLDATEEEMIAAAKQAEIHDQIMQLPDAYGTQVGERGGTLSNGQRQRLAIARALLRRPSILLLDEATSALDAETEAQINATLANVTRQLTTIAVTHRLASAAQADHIFVLDHGRLVEQGSHDQLMETRGLYARLFEEQYGAKRASGAETRQASRLRRVPLFADLPLPALRIIADQVWPERFVENDVIIHQGDVGDKLYLIEQGCVEVAVASPTGERVLDTLQDGDYFGEIALLLDIPRTATVRALGPCRLLALSRADFQTLVERLPQVSAQLTPIVRERVAAQQGQSGSAEPA